MAKIENARSFLENYLPGSILELLDIDKLKVEKDSFVSSELSEYLSDMLYLVPCKDGREGHVYILLEHKSYQEPWVALQILEYMVQCWRKIRTLYLQEKKKEKQKKKEQPSEREEATEPENAESILETIAREKFHLPVIIPIVLYHSTGPWPHGDSSLSMFDCDEKLLQFIPHFSYILCDLIQKPEDKIYGNPTLQIMLRLFKFVRTPVFEKKLEFILSGLGKDIVDGNLLDTIKTVITYILSVSDIEPKKLSQIISHNLSSLGGDIMITTAEKLRIEGRKEGKIKGKIEMFLEMKFGEEGLACMEKINLIENIAHLNQILEIARNTPDLKVFQVDLEPYIQS